MLKERCLVLKMLRETEKLKVLLEYTYYLITLQKTLCGFVFIFYTYTFYKE